MLLACSTIYFQSCSDDKDPVASAVTISQPENEGVIIKATPVEAVAGEKVTISIVLPEKYEFSKWNVTCGGNVVEVEDPTALETTFIMPDGAVNVGADFFAPGEKFGLTMVKIPAGTRMLGSESNEPSYYKDEFLHEVTISKDFYMSAYEITNAQFCEFLNAVGIGADGEGPVGDSTEGYVYDSTTRDSGKFNFGVNYDGTKWVPAAGYEDHPVIYVSWYGANAYAEWVGGSLPTEAQWEYACRANQTEQLPFGIGDGTKMVQGMAQFYVYDYYDLAQGGRVVDQNVQGYVSSTYKVGSFEPNAWGLYDMHGNAYEWVYDHYANYPSQNTPIVDYAGPDSGSQRVLRGGGWVNSGRELRTAMRWSARPTGRMEHYGFRVVL